MKLSKIVLFLIFGFSSFLTGCGLIEEELASATEAETVASSATEILSSAMELALPVLDSQWGAGCMSSTSCSANGADWVRSMTVTACEISDNLTASGQMNLISNNSSCTATSASSVVGDHVSRHVTRELNGFSTFKLISQTDPLEAGQKLTNTGLYSYEFSSSKLTRSGELLNGALEIFNISARTSTNLSFVPNATHDGVSLMSGSIAVVNNNLNYSVNLVPSGIEFVNCACPTSGTLRGTSNGSKNSSMSMDYNTGNCNTAKFSFEGQSKTVVLDTCLAF